MPVAIRVSNRSKELPSRFLMPLAFASLLGGLTTLIGTPPNIVISNFRQEEASVPFHMFDFMSVGLGIAVAGILFISLVGWRLIPSRKAPLAMGDTLHIEDYMTEVRVPENSRLVGKLVHDLEEMAEEDVAIAVFYVAVWFTERHPAMRSSMPTTSLLSRLILRISDHLPTQQVSSSKVLGICARRSTSR